MLTATNMLKVKKQNLYFYIDHYSEKQRIAAQSALLPNCYQIFFNRLQDDEDKRVGESVGLYVLKRLKASSFGTLYLT
jgi:hypothetical protein